MAVSTVSDIGARIDKLLAVIEPDNSFSYRDQLVGPLKFLKVKLNQMKDFLQEQRSRRQDEYEDKMLLTPYLEELGELASKAEDVIQTRPKGIKAEEVISKIINTGRLFIGPPGATFSNEGPLKYLIRPHPDQYFVEDNYVVGFDDDIEKLVSVLVNDDRSSESYHVVVYIWGKGGSGKTALAKKLYHDSRVRNHFDLFAWTHISQKCQRRNVWERILIALNISLDEKKDDEKKPHDQKVAEKLFLSLKEKKCLLILDNIRSIEDWSSIKAALPRSGETNSKILITCRNQEIREAVGPNCYPHELKGLNEEKSLELFQKIASPRLQQLQGNRIGEQKVKEMVLGCEGLPLAIALLGGICATLRDENNSWWLIENWKNREHELLDLQLALSYDAMPSPLKSCFLYMSLFPDGYEISVVKLIQLWVAEYIIPFQSLMHKESGGPKIWIEDAAECYLMELVERRVVQVGERDASSKIKTCYMNDTIREFCVSKTQEVSFARIIDTTSKVGSHHLPVQRLATHVYNDINQIESHHMIQSLFFFNVIFSDEFTYESLPGSGEIYSTNDVSWLSTLLLLRRVIKKFTRFWRCLIKNFEKLIVLEFEGAEIYVKREFLGDIGRLSHLRYLNLQTASCVSKLPSSLGDLIKLQTLNLGIDGRFVVNVPDVIWKLKSLRHLYLPNACDDETKLRLDTLRVLQTLVNFNTKHCSEGDLCKMTNLRELKISGHFILQNVGEGSDFNNPSWRINVTNYEHLRSLSISSPEIDPEHLIALLSHCVNICELTLTSKIKDHKLPALADHQFSSNLTYIYLRNSDLGTNPMPKLEKLPNLKVLELQKAFTEKEIVCSSKGFPQLESLKLIDNSDLEEWKVEEEAMPKLRNLEIVNCIRLKMLPQKLGDIETLKVLKMEKMPQEFKARLMEEVRKFRNFNRISPIIFQNCNKAMTTTRNLGDT